MRFVRLSENALDLEFIESFIWQQGQMKLRLKFWADEAVDDYGIADVATCGVEVAPESEMQRKRPRHSAAQVVAKIASDYAASQEGCATAAGTQEPAA